ncbi:hypothetical protein ANANG_G00014500 [Anguilla anguilla]|uniref:Uncharacterized protein n=1 Tax=Anguilla anguilla TaxID=7936 RepID=A0A9D3S666_ANGAN|nr:hypothetical protein ANANG_G00014500 [Anguilla anguilla]
MSVYAVHAPRRTLRDTACRSLDQPLHRVEAQRRPSGHAACYATALSARTSFPEQAKQGRLAQRPRRRRAPAPVPERAAPPQPAPRWQRPAGQERRRRARAPAWAAAVQLLTAALPVPPSSASPRPASSPLAPPPLLLPHLSSPRPETHLAMLGLCVS